MINFYLIKINNNLSMSESKDSPVAVPKLEKFDIQYVIQQLQKLIDVYIQQKEILFDQFCNILDQFCYVFKALNSFLGIAFSDVQQKVTIIRTNNQIFKNMPGFLSFVQLQMEKNIHIYNGDNNNSLKSPKQYRKYNSTSRNLLRMMWLFTFIRVTFQQMKNPEISMPDILCKAYDAAFGEKHSWLLRKGAKFAIKASGDRQELIDAVMGKDCNQEKFKSTLYRFVQRFVPIHQALWGYYREHKLTDLQ